MQRPDSTQRPANHEIDLFTYLSDDEVVDIVFDSFEVSQAIGSIQNFLFLLVSDKFPLLRVPSTPIDVLAHLFLEKYKNFLGDGKYHRPRDDMQILSGAQVYIGVFKDILNKTWLVSETQESPQPAIVETIINRDYYYLVERTERPHQTDGNKYTSYAKKYFIDTLLSKNTYLRSVMGDLQGEFFDLLEKEGFHLHDENGILLLENATQQLGLESETSKWNLSSVQKLLVVSSTWEKLNGRKQFWKKSIRETRSY
ncbi:MAG: hypothetical protein ABI758_05500 [Candidatus Woesebacteria bacterium]